MLGNSARIESVLNFTIDFISGRFLGRRKLKSEEEDAKLNEGRIDEIAKEYGVKEWAKMAPKKVAQTGNAIEDFADKQREFERKMWKESALRKLKNRKDQEAWANGRTKWKPAKGGRKRANEERKIYS